MAGAAARHARARRGCCARPRRRATTAPGMRRRRWPAATAKMTRAVRPLAPAWENLWVAAHCQISTSIGSKMAPLCGWAPDKATCWSHARTAAVCHAAPSRQHPAATSNPEP